MNEIEMKKTIKISETKSLFFAKINKINKPLARLIDKKKMVYSQISKNRSEKGKVVIGSREIQRIRDCYKQLYANKMDNL